jgi:DNA invertase Pin-like site-specific DNA recombinase
MADRDKKLRAYSYVRMSTEAQLRGDSLRRQVAQSQEYAASQGWELLAEDQLEDIGISAFSGANVSGGALGQFLQAIREGKVEPGSFLIIESLDRLSRQELWKSLGLFSEIINGEVKIVSLGDGRTYTVESDLSDLIYSMVHMSRAHEESRMKSHRLRAVWSNKRKNADALKLTAQCPGWLRLSADKKKFHVIQERADVVLRIFEDSAAGIGNYSITRRLNQARVPPFGRAKGWHTSSVSKILGNRAVLGEFQPHRLSNGTRVAEGDPIKGYFPAILPEQLFYRAQNAKNERRVKGAGRKGSNISNLFSGIAKCAYCQSSMAFENKGRGPKGGTYLVCGAAKRGLGCEKTGWRYNQFEASFLAFVKELDLESLVRGESETKRRADLDNEITALRGRLASLDEQRERTFELFAKSGCAADFVGQKLHALEDERAQMVNALAQKEQERDRLKSELSGFYESKEQIKALIDRLQQSKDDDVYKLRAQISARLKSLVAEILVAPLGTAPMTGKAITLKGERITVAEQKDRNPDSKHPRYFLIGFKDGTLRAVVPKENDPLEFEQQMVASKELGILLTTPGGKTEQLIRRREHRVSLYSPPSPKSADKTDSV